MSRPNFFLVGAAKSGTTALYQALRQHGDVYLPAIKEPHVYAFLADPSTAGHLYPDEATARAHYRDIYAKVSGQTAVGDGSTTSLVVKGAAAAIAQDVPSARIVAILRQPVDRAFSHWCHFVAAGGEDITNFPEALRQEESRQAAGYPFTYRYLGWSHYHDQLTPFYQHFDRDRILVHLYDDLLRNPEAVVRRTLLFLGVNDSADVAPVGRFNEMPIPRFPRVVAALRGRGRTGKVLRRALPSRVTGPLADRVARHHGRRPTLEPEVRAELTAAFSEEISRLEELIGRDLSSWR